MNEKRRPRAVPMTAVLICAALLLTWFAAMLGITRRTVNNCTEYFEVLGRTLSLNSRLSSDNLAERSSDYVENMIWEVIDRANQCREPKFSSGGVHFSGSLSRDFEHQTAMAVYDGEGNLLAHSGDYFYFPYDTEEVWNSLNDPNSVNNTCGYARAMVNMNDLQEQSPEVFGETGGFYALDARVMRFTGVLEGTTLVLNKAEYITRNEFYVALHSREPDEHYIEADGSEHFRYEYSVSEVVRTEQIPWKTLFDSGNIEEGAVTLYTTMANFSEYTSRDSGLLSQLLSMGVQEDIYPNSKTGTREMTVFCSSTMYDYQSELIPDGQGGEVYPVKYIITTATRFFPLRSAMTELRNMYLTTGALTVLLAVVLFWKLRRRLILPVQQINFALSDSESFGGSGDNWQEYKELEDNCSNLADRLRMYQNEITRLNTALEYAKTAEQNRRQMTSNIAHELKTPLAVIHSYAEGLKEHIAEDKRDKYIDVILSEAERTDSMVLEMLDLSRLEAGKVKLSRDDVSLLSLTRSTFEKLEMAAQAKELQIEFSFPDDFTITADEARIAQVIENFATNAIKYTPVGGHIAVKIQNGRFTASFAIENDSEPLSDEALSKVWDTFYRTDEARSSGGTGLGLAIVKNIVELHGGKCYVRNTKSGVEFGFAI